MHNFMQKCRRGDQIFSLQPEARIQTSGAQNDEIFSVASCALLGELSPRQNQNIKQWESVVYPPKDKSPSVSRLVPALNLTLSVVL